MFGHMLKAKGSNIISGRNGAWFQIDRNANFFAQSVVRDAKHRAFCNACHLVQCCFNFTAINVLAAPKDHVFHSVNNENEAVFIDRRHVSSVQPAVGD